LAQASNSVPFQRHLPENETSFNGLRPLLTFCAIMNSIALAPLQQRLAAMCGVSSCKGKSNPQRTMLIVGVLVLIVFPFDIEHLLTMVAGAGVYYVIRSSSVRVKSLSRPKKMADVDTDGPHSGQSVLAKHRVQVASTSRTSQQVSHSKPQSDVRTITVVPVTAPTFQSSTWEAEVNELLSQITPTSGCKATVAEIGRIVKRKLSEFLPDFEIESFIYGNLDGGKAFGVAVPDVEFILLAHHSVLAKHVDAKRIAGVSQTGRVTESCLRQLNKCAIRTWTDSLVSETGLKFRRSAFQGEEPKVTLLAPATFGVADVSVPFDFAVNSTTPMHAFVLLGECEKIDPRAKELVLLVRRWAKNRAVCFSPKGHLSPYLWSLLTIFYMQAGSSCQPKLPLLEVSKTADGCISVQSAQKSCEPGARPAQGVYELFKGFFRFYAAEFDWRTKTIAIHAGKCATSVRGKWSDGGPSIEDPFATGRNLGSCMTADSIVRLEEELLRADRLCTSAVSLSILLDPWVPPDAAPVEPVRKTSALHLPGLTISPSVKLSAPILATTSLRPQLGSRRSPLTSRPV